jgi:hypothetical protein
MDLWRWSLSLVLTLCVAEFVRKHSWLFTVKLINDITYSHGSSKISDFMNRLLCEFLGLEPVIILRTFLCGRYNFTVKWNAPKNIPYFFLEWK